MVCRIILDTLFYINFNYSHVYFVMDLKIRIRLLCSSHNYPIGAVKVKRHYFETHNKNVSQIVSFFRIAKFSFIRLKT
jgi:hypothetical protein